MNNKFALTFAALASLISAAASANEICTIGTYRGNGIKAGHVLGVPTVDLSKMQGNYLIKADGTFLPDVDYAAATGANPAAKLGSVEGAYFINVSRDQGQNQGVNILAATLADGQEMAHFSLAAHASSTNELLLQDLEKNVFVSCIEEKKN